MNGIIDMHVHTNPDIRHRAYDDFQLTEAAVRAGARAIVIKTHQGSTVERAYLCNQYRARLYPDSKFTMFGGITSNRQAGGINPYAVETALKLGGKVVWLPTQSARNHMQKQSASADGCVDVIRDGRLVPELYDVFKLICQFNAVLATAHLSPDESFLVVEAAKNAGIQKNVITHPEWQLVGMRLEDQLRMVQDYGVILERCFAQPLGGGKYMSNLPSNLEAIRACGYQHVMVSTDGGQVNNPLWEEALRQYVDYLAQNGIPENEIRYMTRSIQAWLLDLAP